MLSTFAGGPNQVTDKTAASNVQYMRTATHNILYTTANSWTYDEAHLKGGAEPWKKAAYAIDAVLGVALAALAVMAVRKYNKQK
jgi:beta-glucosidase